MAAATPDQPWLALGNAQIIDWKHLDRDPSARGATAWIGQIGGETALIRTWCEETTTHFEFAVLAHPRLNGRITVRVARPETHRLTVKIEAEIPGEVGYSETAEFEEHPRTGLQGAVTREVDVTSGAFDPAGNPSLTAPQVEIFEYAPESALHTACGAWLAGVLERVRAHVVDGIHEAPRAEVPRVEVPRVEAAPRRKAEPEASVPDPEPPRRAPVPAEPTPPPRAPTPAAPREPTPPPPRADRLFASTNAGDSWELTDDETYIGRSKQCSIVLKSQRVSRKHASITRESEGWFINDLGAANGIWAGTDKIDREIIEDGSEYIIGDVLITFTYS